LLTLTLPPTWKKIHPVFNESLLTPYREPKYPSQQQPNKPPPIIVNDMEEFKVKEILDSQMYRRKLQYLVKWKGYPNCVDWTWEPESNLNTPPKPSKTSIYHIPKHLADSMLIFDSIR